YPRQLRFFVDNRCLYRCVFWTTELAYTTRRRRLSSITRAPCRASVRRRGAQSKGGRGRWRAEAPARFCNPACYTLTFAAFLARSRPTPPRQSSRRALGASKRVLGFLSASLF